MFVELCDHAKPLKKKKTDFSNPAFDFFSKQLLCEFVHFFVNFCHTNI